MDRNECARVGREMENNMNALAEKECVSCKSGTRALNGGEIAGLVYQLNPAWRAVDQHHLEREYKFRDFREALAFTNRVGELAESVRHHPDIFLAWGSVKLTLWTHSIGGLSESDFIFAAKVDAL